MGLAEKVLFDADVLPEVSAYFVCRPFHDLHGTEYSADATLATFSPLFALRRVVRFVLSCPQSAIAISDTILTAFGDAWPVMAILDICTHAEPFSYFEGNPPPQVSGPATLPGLAPLPAAALPKKTSASSQPVLRWLQRWMLWELRQ
ncbi:hypothetical protein C8Q77DRAFT_1161069 [Trametes polyzona]|nr:hypothetical protein C8Q77DRAFT_1161069 [Trametes polyzona]